MYEKSDKDIEKKEKTFPQSTYFRKFIQSKSLKSHAMSFSIISWSSSFVKIGPVVLKDTTFTHNGWRTTSRRTPPISKGHLNDLGDLKRLVKLIHGISMFSCSQTRPTGIHDISMFSCSQTRPTG